jgi:hypothetical protein
MGDGFSSRSTPFLEKADPFFLIAQWLLPVVLSVEKGTTVGHRRQS